MCVCVGVRAHARGTRSLLELGGPLRTFLVRDELLHRGQTLADLKLTRLHDLARHDDLVENGVDLLEVEHNVQLAHVLEVRVEGLHKEVDELQHNELVVMDVDADGEEETCVAPVDDLVRAELDKVRELRVTRRHHPVDILLQLLPLHPRLLAFCGLYIPLRDARLALPVLQQQEANLLREDERGEHGEGEWRDTVGSGEKSASGRCGGRGVIA